MGKFNLNEFAFICTKSSGGNVQYPPDKLGIHFDKDVLYKNWDDYVKNVYSSHKKIGIYIHTPYCESKCVFCECLSKKIESGDILDEYLEKLFDEMDYLKGIFNNIEFDSLYFGGGTPSIYTPKQMDYLLTKIHSNFKFKKDYQINFETSPLTLNEEKIKVLSKFGVERITIGIQTMTEASLEINDRKQTWKMVENIFKWRKQYNIKYVNIDLISGLQGDNMKDFLLNLKRLIGFKPDMFHIYPFRPTENTRYVKGGNIYSEVEMKVRDYTYTLGKKLIEKSGYFGVKNDSWGLSEGSGNKQEIDKIVSNCSILGFGASAHSQIFKKLTYSSPDSNKYVGIDSEYLGVFIDELDSSIKYIISHFRNGFNINDFNILFNIDFENKFKNELIFLKNNKIGYIENGYFKTNIKNVFEKLLYSKVFYKEKYIDFYKKNFNYYEDNDYIAEFKNFVSESFK